MPQGLPASGPCCLQLKNYQTQLPSSCKGCQQSNLGEPAFCFATASPSQLPSLSWASNSQAFRWSPTPGQNHQLSIVPWLANCLGKNYVHHTHATMSLHNMFMQCASACSAKKNSTASLCNLTLQHMHKQACSTSTQAMPGWQRIPSKCLWCINSFHVFKTAASGFNPSQLGLPGKCLQAL